MEAAKTSSYLGLTSLANVLFVLFVLAWVALRMVAFPGVIIRSTMFEVVEVRRKAHAPRGHPLNDIVLQIWFTMSCMVAFPGAIIRGTMFKVVEVRHWIVFPGVIV